MDKSHMDCAESKISITTSLDGKKTNVVIDGSCIATLFNFVVLSRDVCEYLGLSPDTMARLLPRYIRDYDKHRAANSTETISTP